MTGMVKTTCPYCGVGCGVLARRQSNGSISVEGDPDHPANFGRLCSKGSALGETVDLDGRLLYPEINGRPTDWDRALNTVADRFADTIREYGPDSVAFYVSGQILTEDYYVANKLMKGFIGSANIDTNSRLCMASSVAGHRRAFGMDTVPGTYEDLEEADVIVLVGSNLLWCHPVLYQRIATAKAKRPGLKVVLIDPRRTKTVDLADMHLALQPDADAALFNGLLTWLNEEDGVAQSWVEEHTNGVDGALKEASAWTVQKVADVSGLQETEIEAFYRLFGGTEKVVTCYSQGVNQSAGGTDKVNAIINCHLITARIGRPGMGPFSLTGQPNAMGGREVGGLANMLAAHMDIENPIHRNRVQRFWGSPAIADKPGLKAIDMFQAVADGRIKALWIMATNPAVSMPDADAVEDAIRHCPFVVVSDVMAETDTVRHAHVKLPSLAWGEKNGTVTNSERRISRQRAFLPAPGAATADWWQMAEVGKRMGWPDAFSWNSPAEIFREHAALTAFENDGSRDLDLAACTAIDNDTYDGFVPFQWPQSGSSIDRAPRRFFSGGGFFTPDRKARFIPVAPPQPRSVSDRFILNTGRVRDHWHTMTRTAKSPRLSGHLAEPYCEIHPEDANRLKIVDADLVCLHNARGSMIVRAMVRADQQPGTVFVPMHWTAMTASSGRVDALVDPVTDPVSGQPALKGAEVALEKVAGAYHGFMISQEKPRTETFDYWAIARTVGGWRLEFALLKELADASAFLRDLVSPNIGDVIEAADRFTGFWQTAGFNEDRLEAAAYLSTRPVPVSRSWASDLLSAEFKDKTARWPVLAGRPAANMLDKGAIICSCLSVGLNQIADAARAGCLSVDAVGNATGAGTNCGSCRAEITEVINAHCLIAAE
ncbi:MAG: nitrate reductase [Stappiaceae bacterium]